MLTIGRTLMGNPDLLLVNGPTEGLAPVMVQEVRDILKQINSAEVSILLVEHNLKVAMSLADRVYLMGKAHLGFTGTKAELEARPDIRAKYLEVQTESEICIPQSEIKIGGIQYGSDKISQYRRY
jgi:branched-chain amino acid transport system ATP-binding protein